MVKTRIAILVTVLVILLISLVIVQYLLSMRERRHHPARALRDLSFPFLPTQQYEEQDTEDEDNYSQDFLHPNAPTFPFEYFSSLFEHFVMPNGF